MAALPVLAGRVPRVPLACACPPAGAVLLGRGFLAFGFPGVSKNGRKVCLKIVYLPAYKGWVLTREGRCGGPVVLGAH